MMKNFIVLVVLFIIGGFVWKQFPIVKNIQTKLNSTASTTPTSSSANRIAGIRKIQKKESIFVPDWNLKDETILHNGYDRWIYFGGNEKIATFTGSLKEKELWMTIKVTNLDELTLSRSEISNLENVGQLTKFRGIVLDLEINGLASDEFIRQINEGVKKLYQEVKKKNLKFAVGVYGDTFFRKRPVNLEFINKNSDEIMVMAYDFSKSYGEPGPNYPYSEFKRMVSDFLKFVPAEKLTFVFGMYGYDWRLKDGKPLGTAGALTLAQIKKNFLGKKCYEKNCVVSTDEDSKEKHVTYEDEATHSIYFEDVESAGIKIKYLKEWGIGSVAYWAWGYF